MTLGIVAAIAYGLLAIIGGIIGYKQAQSKMSLISGLVSGSLLVLGGILQLQGFNVGLMLAAAIAAVLMVVFAIRLGKTRKFMPSGVMLLTGIAAFTAMVLAI